MAREVSVPFFYEIGEWLRRHVFWSIRVDRVAEACAFRP